MIQIWKGKRWKWTLRWWTGNGSISVNSQRTAGDTVGEGHVARVGETRHTWYQLPTAAGQITTNNPTGLDQRSIIDWQGCVPSGGIREEWAPLPLPASRGFPYCLARGPLHTSLPTSASHRHFPSSDSSCLPLVQTLVFTLGPPDILGKSPHLSIFNLLTSAKFLLPYEVTYSQVPELGRRQLWEPGLYLLHTLFLRTVWNRGVMWSIFFFFKITWAAVWGKHCRGVRVEAGDYY